MNCRTLHCGPLFNPDGSVAVHDHPRLAVLKRALERGQEWRKRWAKVHGDEAAQHRLLRRECGLSKPMPPEVKEKLRAAAATPEAKEARKRKLRIRRRLRAVTRPRGRRAS